MSTIEGGLNIIDNGLILYLDAAKPKSLTNSNIIWYDLSKLSKKATIVNGPTFTTEKGGGLVFDGTNDYVTLGTDIDYYFNLTKPFTVSIWFKANILKNAGLINRFNGGVLGNHFLTLSTNGTITFHREVAPFNLFSNTKISTGIIYNVVATYDGTSTAEGVFLYINNVSQSKVITHNNLTTSIQTTYGLNIGARTAPGTEGYFLGNFAFTQIYNRVLTPAEISQNYNATKSRFGLL
jgi:hypothetical protein